MRKRHQRIRIFAWRGFTLVELLIAMTLTLLLMAALAKSFGVIGESIKEGRSKVSLSSQLRGVTFRIRTDLGSRTVDATPPLKSQSGEGYFMYYEGPLTEHTFGLFGAEPAQTTSSGDIVRPGDALYNNAQNGPTYRRHSRFGDFDDYIAFTAEAPGDDWFTGKVPAYLVDDTVTAANAMEPRVVRSKFAEIIIWASPRWQVDPATNDLQVAAHPSAMPLYRDEDNDLVPDEVVLHHRVLLIRPDLNVRRKIPFANSNLVFETDVLRPQAGLVADDPPYAVPAALQRLYPIGLPNPTTGSPPAPMFPSYAVAASETDNRQMLNSNWLVGMAPLHHFFDLSLRRIVHPSTGWPTGYVAANSLQDLVQPHNRFAHVRYPGRYFGRGSFTPTNANSDTVTSMPLLALGWNDAILNWQGIGDPRAEPPSAAAPGWFPTSHPSPLTLNSNATSTSSSGLFNGWLLPHFELGDPNPAGVFQGENWQRGYLSTADPAWDRTGEDVIAANVLAFDVRGFDPTAPVFLTSGRDGEPGKAGEDDDGDGSIDQTVAIFGEPASELGAPGSDDEIVSVSDLACYGLLFNRIVDPDVPSSFSPLASAVHHQSLATRGAFVDLMYPYLAGSALRERTAQGRTTVPANIPTTPAAGAVAVVPQVQANYSAFMSSSLSGFELNPSALDSMKRSGRLVHFGTAGGIIYMQPTYDTWTDGYESDGFDQSQALTGAVSGGSNGTIWIQNSVSGFTVSPRLPATTSTLQIDTGRFIQGETETTPPFSINLPAISVDIRVVDPLTEEMMQFSVVEELQ